MKKINLCLVVWGSYYNLFVDYCLGSILSENNLGNKDIRNNLTFTISTTNDIKNKLNSNENFNRLKNIINVKFIKAYIKNSGTFKSQIYNINLLIKDAIESKNDGIIIMYPDAIYADNSITNAIKRAQEYEAVMSYGNIRILENDIDDYDFEKGISSRLLSRLVLTTPHPFLSNRTIDNYRHTNVEAIIWNINKETWLIRSLYRYIVYFDLKHFKNLEEDKFYETVILNNINLNKDNTYTFNDSDEYLLLDIADKSKIYQSSDNIDIYNLIENWILCENVIKRTLDDYYILHCSDVPDIKNVVDESQKFVDVFYEKINFKGN